jgi:hypothetical protein
MISLLCPTRKRPDAAKRMVQSAWDTADNPLDVEVLFRLDDDDPESTAALTSYQCVIGPRGRGYIDIGSFYNELATEAFGDILGIMNDDVLFITKGWDTELYKAAKAYKHGIVCMLDSAGEFPFVTRRWIEALGGITDARETHCDTFIGLVGQNANCMVRVPPFLLASCLDDVTFHEAQALVKQYRTPQHFDDPDHVAWRLAAIERVRDAIHRHSR